MKAYCCGITKQEFLAEIKKHQAADNFIQNTYFDEETNKGCAVGCSLESISRLRNISLSKSDHAAYEKYLGIPAWLAELEDRVFEGLDLEAAKQWPLKFSAAINEGADLNKVEDKFKIFVLRENIKQLTTLLKTDLETNVKQVVNQSISVNKQMIDAIKSKDKEQIGQAKQALYLVAAYSVAEYSVALSAALSAAYSAALSAAYSADSAANSAEYAATDSAVRSECLVVFFPNSAAYNKIANKLLKLIRSCK